MSENSNKKTECRSHPHKNSDVKGAYTPTPFHDHSGTCKPSIPIKNVLEKESISEATPTLGRVSEAAAISFHSLQLILFCRDQGK